MTLFPRGLEDWARSVCIFDSFLDIKLSSDFMFSFFKESVMLLFSKWKRSWNGLAYLSFWIETSFAAWTECNSCEDLTAVHCSHCEGWQRSLAVADCICNIIRGDKDFLKIDTSVKKKCRTNIDPSFWKTEFPLIVNEFFAGKSAEEYVPSIADITQIVLRDSPKITQCMSILEKKCAWTTAYALEKMIPLLTRWQLEHLSSGGVKEVLRPLQIVKRRIVARVSSLLIKWTVFSSRAEEESALPASFESCEPAELVRNAYPDLVDDFVANENNKKKKRSTNPTVTSRRRKKQGGSTVETGTQPITEFFTQRKTHLPSEGRKSELLQDGIAQNKAVSEAQTDPVLMNDSDILGDNSDLSLIIDGILSKKVLELSCHKEQQPVQQEVSLRPLTKLQELLTFATSTPVVARGSIKSPPFRVNRQPIKPNPSLKSHKLEKDDKEAYQESSDFVKYEEDSYDRMCN